MEIREARSEDLEGLLALYAHLHGDPPPPPSDGLNALWRTILTDSNHHILLGLESEQLVSSCVLVVVPNLTHGQRPYGLVENVVTHGSFRGRGFATALLNRARDLAREARCYKLMLLTGSKRESTLRFYERAGYSRADKTGFVQWL